MKMKFTDRAIAALSPPPGKKDCFHSATQMEHALVRVTPISQIFYYGARLEDGVSFRKKIGKFPGVNVARLFKAVKVLDGKLAAGVDLRAEKATRKAEQVQARTDAAYTFGDLTSDWEKALQKARRSSYAKGAPNVVRRAYSKLLDRPANSITEAQLEEALNSLTSGSTAVRMAGEKVRTLFNWGVRHKKVKDNPAKQLVLGEKRKPRQNFLTGDEARLVWRAGETLPTPYGQFIQVLEASMLRLREAAGLRWSWFNADLSEVTIPGEYMKEGEPHVVWLSSIVCETLRRLPRFAGCDYVFSVDGKKPISGFTHLKKRLDKALVGSAVKPFVFHDLRRSGTTWLVRNGTDSIVADRLLAHVGLAKISAVASTYNLYDFETERRTATAKWIAFLTGGKELEVLPGPLPMLPVPSEATDARRDTIPPLVILEDFRHAGGRAFEPADTERSFIADLAPHAGASARETAGKYACLILTILTDLEVEHANSEIRKTKLTRAFLEEFPDNSHSEAIKALTYRAADLALNGATVLKRSEVEAWKAKWNEEARWRRRDAELDREGAERARASGREEDACEAIANAERLEDEAFTAEQMSRAYITTDDPRCVEYRSAGATHKSSRTLGMLQALKMRNAEIFGNEHATWATTYANAAVGRGGATRFQGRRRPRIQILPPGSAAQMLKCALPPKSQLNQS